MSNTSYSFKENSHVIVNQGGEKKVMKKILSVALSTAMAFSMFASVAFGADAKLTPEQQFNALKEAGIVSGFPDGLSHLEKTLTRAELAKIIVNSLSLEPVDATSYNDKNYANHWGRPYIEAATQAGILNGKDAVKKLFDPNGAVTVQELAKVLVTALKLEVPADANNTASEWAKGYVAAAVNAGYLADGINYQAQATRSQAVVAAYAIYEAAQVPTVKSYNVVDSKNVEFTLSNGEVVKVTLEKALEANKETEVTFKTAAGEEITTKVTYVITTATKVEKVTASNLKEIEVSFDGTVDKTSAEDKDKYSVDSSVELESATLLEDGKTVRLGVKVVNGNVLQNQKSYKISVKNVKAGNTTVDAKDVAFTPIDNALPEVTEVKSLGTKAVKVTFSEPIKKAASTNFKLDGKTFFGTTTEGSREVVLKPYNSGDLSVGAHKLEVSGVEDYHTFKALSKEFEFSVAEDTTAPTVASVNATLERVTVTFSEEVDSDTVEAANVYWKSGNDKKAAGSVTRISGSVYEFDFTSNSLPGYETSLFVENVKDYSGNVIKETEVKVKAELDQTRPEVTDVSISKLDNKAITLKFNKQVKIEDVKYFTLTKSNGDVVPLRNVVASNGTTEDKVFTLYAYDALTASYTLKIVGVRDTTKLQNTILDYSVTLNGKDSTAPAYSSNSGNGRTLIINFDKELDLASAGDAGNYLVVINSRTQQLPAGTEVTPQQKGKSVRIVFPEYIDNAKVGINDSTAGANVTAFQLLALKDTAGNIITNFGAAPVAINSSAANLAADYDSDTTGFNAKLTAKGEIKVKFDQPIGRATAADFEVLSGTGVAISSVTADGTDVVTVKLSGTLNETGLYDSTDSLISIGVKANSGIVATSGNAINAAAQTITVKDGIKPQVKLANNQYRLGVTGGNVINLPFSELLDGTGAANFKYDLVVTNVKTGKALPVTDYTTALGADNKSVDITITAATDVEYTVAVKDGANFIVDADGNAAVKSSAYYTEVGAVDTVDPSVTTALTTEIAAGASKQIVFSEVLDAASKTAVETAIDGAANLTAGDLVFTWSGSTLTVKNNNATTATTFGSGNVTANIADLAGNTATVNVVVIP
ncbi:S-layer homology domain-containing protein [Paenibacillus barengoltzii]|uniref:S-layer homology domain-containing protein n=1 Tax=Paenibacillus barengoltzii TaxID=343517 RepID=UPI003F8B6AF6